MVKFEFEKILKLLAMNKDFFAWSNGFPVWKVALKSVFLLLLTPIYLCTELFACILYFWETLLTIPSKLVHGIRMANTPYDENNRTTYTVSYILLYLWIVPFDAFAIFTSWMIALLSLFLDCLGNIVNLGGRHLASFELCFSTDSDEDPQSHKHFWLMVLGVAVMIFIIVVGDKLAMSFATETIVQRNTSGLRIETQKIDYDLYDIYHIVSLVIAYVVPTVLLTLLYTIRRKANVMISSGTTSIGFGEFANHRKLQNITIPANVANISGYAFSNCSSLTGITIPSSVTNIGDYAFSDCSSLTSITFQGTKAQWAAISKGANWNSSTGVYTIHCTDGDIAK